MKDNTYGDYSKEEEYGQAPNEPHDEYGRPLGDINAKKLEILLNFIIDQQDAINSMDEKIKELDEQLRLLVDLFHDDQYARIKAEGLVMN